MTFICATYRNKQVSDQSIIRVVN